MNGRDIKVIAVTGLNATDNPGPGVGVIRALRHQTGYRGRIVGLAYDALEPGTYAEGLLDDVFLIPYPSQGTGALRERLEYVRKRVGGLDVVIPTLDAELPAFIELSRELAFTGTGTLLPSAEQLELRSKARLPALGERGLPVPPSRVLTAVEQLYAIHEVFAYPIVVKGPYYGARIARSLDEAISAFHKMVAEWGYPVIVQQFVAGEELCVMCVGDGEGGMVGAISMRKTVITDKGKGWAGVAVRDPGLDALAEAFMRLTKWRGPCELEVIRDPKGGYHVLEINPRFPAWCYLSAGAGMNLPWAVASIAAGRPVPRMRDYRVGTMFVRIALDQIADIATFSRITTAGEIVRSVAAELPAGAQEEVSA
jgi:carbamoyl-phosphate synthase large subunit